METRLRVHKAFLALDKYLWFQKTKELTTTGTILDLGGGEGLFEALFQGGNQQATILEVSAQNRNLAGNAEYVVYGGETFPFRNHCFEVGIALQTLEHVPPRLRQHAIAELVRVVRKQIIFAFPTRRLHFERLFWALFVLYAIIGLPRMKTFYEEHLRYGLPKPELVSDLVGHRPTSSEYYFGRLSCLVLLIQLAFPILLPLSAFFSRAIGKLNDREPVFALLCWNRASD